MYIHVNLVNAQSSSSPSVPCSTHFPYYNSTGSRGFKFSLPTSSYISDSWDLFTFTAKVPSRNSAASKNNPQSHTVNTQLTLQPAKIQVLQQSLTHANNLSCQYLIHTWGLIGTEKIMPDTRLALLLMPSNVHKKRDLSASHKGSKTCQHLPEKSG